MQPMIIFGGGGGAGCAGIVKTTIRFIRFLSRPPQKLKLTTFLKPSLTRDCSKTALSGKHITIMALNMWHAYLFWPILFNGPASTSRDCHGCYGGCHRLPPISFNFPQFRLVINKLLLKST